MNNIVIYDRILHDEKTGPSPASSPDKDTPTTYVNHRSGESVSVNAGDAAAAREADELKRKQPPLLLVWHGSGMALRLHSKQNLGTFSIFFRSFWSIWSVWPL